MFAALRSASLPVKSWISQTCKRRALSSSTPRSSIEKLLDSFREPSSPFYIAPGTQGPSSPGDGFIIPEKFYTQNVPRELHASSAKSASDGENGGAEALTPEDEGRAKLIELGHDPLSFYEQKVVWGDQDPFRHVNNVRYVRYLESARIQWMKSLALQLGGPQKARDMISGKGISLILSEISVRFRRPVVYPDTLLIAHKPYNPFPMHFKCAAAIWSYSQRAIVATSDSTLVWYDYDQLKKCDPGEEAHAVLASRMRQ